MAQARPFGQVVVNRDDLRRFNREVRRAADANLPRRIGEAHKRVGQKFIRDWLTPKPDPAAVGVGSGADVRPSATKREVQLLVGGAHRAGHTPEMQWGKRPGRQPNEAAPKRPWIRGSVDRHQRDLEQEYLEAVSDAMSPAFYDTEP
jgi:hypothetical protein